MRQSNAAAAIVGGEIYVRNLCALWQTDPRLAIRLEELCPEDLPLVEKAREGGWTSRSGRLSPFALSPMTEAAGWVGGLKWENRYAVVVGGFALGITSGHCGTNSAGPRAMPSSSWRKPICPSSKPHSWPRIIPICWLRRQRRLPRADLHRTGPGGTRGTSRTAQRLVHRRCRHPAGQSPGQFPVADGFYTAFTS